MLLSEKHTPFHQDNNLFLSRSYTSKEEFETEYRKFYNEETKAKELYLQILIELESIIPEDNVNRLNDLSSIVDYVNNIEHQVVLRACYDNPNNPIKNTNLIILACKHNKLNILEFLLNRESKILNNLSIGIGKTSILPDHQDETCHNAFYYAIRSGNVALLNTLIEKWPDNYFFEHLDELDEIISIVYEDLMLKKVLLSNEVVIFIENKLINLRFFSDKVNYKDDQMKRTQISFSNIEERIGLIHDNIGFLKSRVEKVDETYLFIAKFIVQNIHILKHQLKSTYDRIPWEEIEFCLISFISSYTKKQDINLCYQTILNKDKILKHLEIFAEKLINEVNLESMDISKLSVLPNLTRAKVIENNYYQFEDLYNDYKQIRDIHSLKKMSDYIELALLADPKERTSQLIISRVLQIIGEYMKNTLQSPKLSNTTSELLLLPLPKNTKKVITDLRNSLSHAYSLTKRIEIEENKDINYFKHIQNDTKKIGKVINGILYKNKIKMITIVLEKIISSENINEIKEVSEILNNVELDEMESTVSMIEFGMLENLIEELSNNITEKTCLEEMLFNHINNIISMEKTKLENMKSNYKMGFNFLKSLNNSLSVFKIDKNIIRGTKFFASKTLEAIRPSKIESYNIKEIAKLSSIIVRSVTSRAHSSNIVELNMSMNKIFTYAQFELGNIKWIEEYREKLNIKTSFISEYKEKEAYRVTNEKYSNQLELKLFELKSVLKQNELNNQLIVKFPSYNKNKKKLQAVIEMLLLDIMSILDCSKNNLVNNLFFIDGYSPLLIGKSLRNHLAHDNAAIDILLSDPLIAIVSNAKTLTSENIIKSKKKIGKIVKDDISKLKVRYDNSLATVLNKEQMFVALEEGNLEGFKKCLKKGADINARNINLWTALHFAAKGPSLEVIKFVLNQNLNINAKDIINQSPLHVAAAYGRKSIVKFFVEEKSLGVNNVDSNGRTPLHIAAKNGHKDIVEILIKNKANTSLKDISGSSPLHYAVTNNYKNVVQILLKKEVNVDCNETLGGFTPLHLAAESGFLEIVIFLLQNKANVNAVNDKGGIPLHTAALNGHVEVVNTLILKGANINSRVIDGCTPLHYAVENGHEKIVDILLKHGVNVNVTDKTYNNTPLHYAATDGYENIVKTLLQNKANANIATVEGLTPLHLAILNGHLNIVTALLKHGVDVYAKNINGFTPLHIASQSGHKEIADTLIKNKAQINAKANHDLTTLHVATMNGHKDIIALLIQNNVEVNAKDSDGFSPLHTAASNSRRDIVELLIKNKAEVNIKTSYHFTPLHVAAMNGNRDIVEILIKNGAEVCGRGINGLTPLHLAAINFNKDVIDLLIKNGANVHAKAFGDNTPLDLALEDDCKKPIKMLLNNMADMQVKDNININPISSDLKNNFKDTVEVLIANGANVCGKRKSNAKPLLDTEIIENLKTKISTIYDKNNSNQTSLMTAAALNYKKIIEELEKSVTITHAMGNSNQTPLTTAIKHNYKEIVELLIANGADVNEDNGTPLGMAIFTGYKDIVKILLYNKAKVNIKYDVENGTALHLAAKRGQKEICNLLITNGAKVNALTIYKATPLHYAAQEGFEEVVEILLANGANVNSKTVEGLTPLHMTAIVGHDRVVDALLKRKVDINIKDGKDRTALSLAVAYNHVEVVTKLLEQKKVNINAKENNHFTLLHIAAQEGNLEITKSLMDKGADINARNNSGSKPIHFAARDGHKVIVEYYLANGLSINDLGAVNQTLLHYTAMKDQLEIAEYLIEQGANVNARDSNGATTMHIAASCGSKGIIELLLKNGANYNTGDKFDRKPIDMIMRDKFKSAFMLLASTVILFEAVQKNNPSEVKNCIQLGAAVVNAKNATNGTPLHYAAWKGYDEIVNVLLEHKANPNSIGNKGFTPLHYAAKFSHIKIVKTLLANGAVYNFLSHTGKTPLDLVVDESIISLFELINESFKNIKQNNSKVITDLNKIKNVDTVRAVMNACDRENKSLIVCAITTEFTKTEQLKQIFQGDISTYIDMSNVLLTQEKYQEALSILRNVLDRRKEILGPDNPGTMDIQETIAQIFYKEQNYKVALKIFEEIYQKRKDIFGVNNNISLKTRSAIALILHRQGKYEEALNIFKDVYQKQKEILGVSHLDILATQVEMALVLTKQEKFEEALCVNYEVFEKYKDILGIRHPLTLVAQNNIATVLHSQGKRNEALKIYQDVYDTRKQVLGPVHSDTLRTLHNITVLLCQQKNYDEAFKSYKEVFDTQKSILGPNHIDTLNTQNNIGNLLLSQGKFISALKYYKECLDQRIAILGENHPDILNTLQKIQIINYRLKLEGTEASSVIQNFQSDIIVAANNGDIEIVQNLLQNGADVNDKDVDGRTPLHFAVNNGHIDVVNNLLKNGANVIQITNKGNTPLHTAVSNNNKEIVEILLHHVSHIKLNDFMNAKTLTSGTTALHVAAKNGFLDIVKSLLKYGAHYNAQNKDGKTPLHLSNDQDITNLLNLTVECFEDTKNGNVKVISKLSSVTNDILVAVTNARNDQGKTLLQVAISNKDKNVTSGLLKILKKPVKNQPC